MPFHPFSILGPWLHDLDESIGTMDGKMPIKILPRMEGPNPSIGYKTDRQQQDLGLKLPEAQNNESKVWNRSH